MKKKHFLYLAIIVASVALIFTRFRVKKQNISDILLNNIECLANPEYPNINCVGLGSLDCPKNGAKVQFYF
jgi:hypothetical protein